MTADRTERELDAALDAAAASIGPLDEFESRVGDAIRARRDATAPRLERAVRATLERVETAPRETTSRRSSLAWIVVAAAAAAVFFAVLLLGELDDRGSVLASVDRGEVRRRGAGEWVPVSGPFRLRGGDEVRAGDEPAILRLGTTEARLFPASQIRVAGVEQPRFVLLTGAIDCESPSADANVVVDTADSWIVLGRSRAQVRRGPSGGVVYAVFDGEASVRSAVRRERLPAGRAVWVRPGGSAWPVYAVDDGPVRTLVSRTRQRWRHYRDREARRRREDGRPAGPPVAVTWWAEPSDRGHGLVAWPRESAVRDRARRILAVHTSDDRRFVERSLVEALRVGIPEIGVLSARALQAMGEPAEAVTAIAEAVPRRDGPRIDAARAAVHAAFGVDATAARFRTIATDDSTTLSERVVALSAVAGLDDPRDAVTAAAAARRGASQLYAVDWRTSTDFCEIVGFVLGATTAGDAAARELVLDRAVPVESRRRYLSAIVSSPRSRWTSLLLEVFYRGEDSLRRATLLALLDDAARAPDAGLAAFFELLVNADSAFTELALVGWWRFGSEGDRRRVIDRIDETVADSPDPELRAAAVRAALTLGESARRIAPILHRALRDEAPQVRRWAALALVRVGRAESIRPVLAAFVRETDAPVAAALARALGRLPTAAADPKVGAALAAALASMSTERLAVIAALGDLGTDFARLILEDLRATVSRPDERFAAEAALESIRSRR